MDARFLGDLFESDVAVQLSASLPQVCAALLNAHDRAPFPWSRDGEERGLRSTGNIRVAATTVSKST